MKEHYETKATDAQKGAGLASASSRWNKHSLGREVMTIKYHESDTTNSPIIGEPVRIHRDKPVPKVRIFLSQH